MKKDRFGNFRHDGYNQDDFLFCKCVPARAKLHEPCRHKPNPKCPSCGGYGEIAKSCAS